MSEFIVFFLFTFDDLCLCCSSFFVFLLVHLCVSKRKCDFSLCFCIKYIYAPFLRLFLPLLFLFHLLLFYLFIYLCLISFLLFLCDDHVFFFLFYSFSSDFMHRYNSKSYFSNSVVYFVFFMLFSCEISLTQNSMKSSASRGHHLFPSFISIFFKF